ncbi:MAG: DUF951 domain-containing protein [Lachnospiraceae bacterium]|jgi:hypothetical protein|nr:DUF951 domain-containing protein [Lachnospiraceae bacterium]MEE3460360.1 DUF951 domain-containing protein [Lachnospiraceae bacterium]
MKDLTFKAGDHAVMKKNHPCGSNEWIIIRTGMDVKLRCCGCGHLIELKRKDFVKRTKSVIAAEDNSGDADNI